jgi:hypothetical protein
MVLFFLRTYLPNSCTLNYRLLNVDMATVCVKSVFQIL